MDKLDWSVHSLIIVLLNSSSVRWLRCWLGKLQKDFFWSRIFSFAPTQSFTCGRWGLLLMFSQVIFPAYSAVWFDIMYRMVQKMSQLVFVRTLNCEIHSVYILSAGLCSELRRVLRRRWSEKHRREPGRFFSEQSHLLSLLCVLVSLLISFPPAIGIMLMLPRRPPNIFKN